MTNIFTKDLAKKNYDRGLWTFSMLKALVKKGLDNKDAIGKLTEQEFKEITGYNYKK